MDTEIDSTGLPPIRIDSRGKAYIATDYPLRKRLRIVWFMREMNVPFTLATIAVLIRYLFTGRHYL